jgi:hypothetical protein
MYSICCSFYISITLERLPFIFLSCMVYFATTGDAYQTTRTTKKEEKDAA